MKKVFLSLAVLVSVALVSCGGHKAAEEANEEANAEQVEEPAQAEVAQEAGVVMKDSITPDGQTIQVPVAAVVEEVAAEQAPAEEAK